LRGIGIEEKEGKELDSRKRRRYYGEGEEQ
jgi:hypothetical protein